MEIKETVLELLGPFGIDRDCLGALQLARAMEILTASPAEIHAVRKGIYIVITDEHSCAWQAVESNLRRLIDHVWEQDALKLTALAGHELARKPTVAQFLQIISQYLLWQRRPEYHAEQP